MWFAFEGVCVVWYFERLFWPRRLRRCWPGARPAEWPAHVNEGRVVQAREPAVGLGAHRACRAWAIIAPSGAADTVVIECRAHRRLGREVPRRRPESVHRTSGRPRVARPSHDSRTGCVFRAGSGTARSTAGARRTHWLAHRRRARRRHPQIEVGPPSGAALRSIFRTAPTSAVRTPQGFDLCFHLVRRERQLTPPSPRRARIIARPRARARVIAHCESGGPSPKFITHEPPGRRGPDGSSLRAPLARWIGAETCAGDGTTLTVDFSEQRAGPNEHPERLSRRFPHQVEEHTGRAWICSHMSGNEEHAPAGDHAVVGFDAGGRTRGRLSIRHGGCCEHFGQLVSGLQRLALSPRVRSTRVRRSDPPGVTTLVARNSDPIAGFPTSARICR